MKAEYRGLRWIEDRIDQVQELISESRAEIRAGRQLMSVILSQFVANGIQILMLACHWSKDVLDNAYLRQLRWEYV